MNNNKDGLGLSGLEDYQNIKVGSLDATPNFYGAVGADRVPPMFERYFTGSRISGPGNIAIKRSLNEASYHIFNFIICVCR